MAIGDKKALPLSVCGKVPDADGNILLNTEDIAGLMAALSDKANSSYGVVDGVDLLAWADAQTIGGAFAAGTTNTNQPEVAWFSGFMEVSEIGARKITLTNSINGRTYINQTANQIWMGWVNLATSADLAGKANAPKLLSAPITDIKAVDAGQYSWVSTSVQAWEPVQTSGARRIVVNVIKFADGWLFTVVYTDGVAKGKAFYSTSYTPVISWAEVATATKPKELLLPLAAGFAKTIGRKCCYSKAQNDFVLVHVAVGHTSGSVPIGDHMCAVLPPGYRPEEYAGDDGSGIFVASDGSVFYRQLAQTDKIIRTIGFYAAP